VQLGRLSVIFGPRAAAEERTAKGSEAVNARRKEMDFMSTLKQIEANRSNAQKSTGPKTPQGREIVSRNAVTHGLTAVHPIVLPDEQEDYDRFAAAMRAEWAAQSALEQMHLDRMIDLRLAPREDSQNRNRRAAGAVPAGAVR
jgi:hypothetical protein